MIHGDDFIIKEKPEKKYFNAKEFLTVFIVVALWIFWVVLYMVFLKPFVSSFFFNYLNLSSYPAIFPIFIIPGIIAILGYHAYRFIKKVFWGK